MNNNLGESDHPIRPIYRVSPAPLARAFRALPKIPGTSSLIASAFRLIPFVRPRLHITVNHLSVPLDVTYPTHVGFLLTQTHGREEMEVLSHTIRSGDTILDLGANWGLISLVAASIVGPGGLVIAIEPNLRAYLRLLATRNHARLANLLPLNIAVSDHSGDLVRMKRPFYRLDTAGFIGPAQDASDSTITATIDDIHRLVGRPDVRLVKLDLEGAEVLALRGSTRLISRVPYALVEVSDYTVRFDGSRQEVYRRMAELGFRWAYFGREDGPSTGAALWPAANVLFARDEVRGLGWPVQRLGQL